MAITVDELLDGLIEVIKDLLPSPSAVYYFKEQMDAWPPSAQSITVIGEGGISSARSPNDEINITIVVAGSDYTDGKDKAMTIYRGLHLAFDVLQGESNWGYNGFWLLDTPRRFMSEESMLTFSNLFVINARTWAETRS